MRAMTFAAVIGLMAAATSAYAQGQSSTAMTVSVRVVRSCNIATPGSDAPRITAQCASAAAPRTQVTAAAPAPSAAAPATLTEPRGDASTFRVLTVNF